MSEPKGCGVARTEERGNERRGKAAPVRRDGEAGGAPDTSGKTQ